MFIASSKFTFANKYKVNIPSRLSDITQYMIDALNLEIQDDYKIVNYENINNLLIDLYLQCNLIVIQSQIDYIIHLSHFSFFYQQNIRGILSTDNNVIIKQCDESLSFCILDALPGAGKMLISLFATIVQYYLLFNYPEKYPIESLISKKKHFVNDGRIKIFNINNNTSLENNIYLSCSFIFCNSKYTCNEWKKYIEYISDKILNLFNISINVLSDPYLSDFNSNILPIYNFDVSCKPGKITFILVSNERPNDEYFENFDNFVRNVNFHCKKRRYEDSNLHDQYYFIGNLILDSFEALESIDVTYTSYSRIGKNQVISSFLLKFAGTRILLTNSISEQIFLTSINPYEHNRKKIQKILFESFTNTFIPAICRNNSNIDDSLEIIDVFRYIFILSFTKTYLSNYIREFEISQIDITKPNVYLLNDLCILLDHLNDNNQLRTVIFTENRGKERLSRTAKKQAKEMIRKYPGFDKVFYKLYFKDSFSNSQILFLIKEINNTICSLITRYSINLTQLISEIYFSMISRKISCEFNKESYRYIYHHHITINFVYNMNHYTNYKHSKTINYELINKENNPMNNHFLKKIGQFITTKTLSINNRIICPLCLNTIQESLVFTLLFYYGFVDICPKCYDNHFQIISDEIICQSDLFNQENEENEENEKFYYLNQLLYFYILKKSFSQEPSELFEEIINYSSNSIYISKTFMIFLENITCLLYCIFKKSYHDIFIIYNQSTITFDRFYFRTSHLLSCIINDIYKDNKVLIYNINEKILKKDDGLQENDTYDDYYASFTCFFDSNHTNLNFIKLIETDCIVYICQRNILRSEESLMTKIRNIVERTYKIRDLDKIDKIPIFIIQYDW